VIGEVVGAVKCVHTQMQASLTGGSVVGNLGRKWKSGDGMFKKSRRYHGSESRDLDFRDKQNLADNQMA
jgi:hypothetical protein